MADVNEAGVRELDEDTVTAEVVASFANTADARVREILTVLTTHLHAAVKELELTLDEWRAGIDFLTATAHSCTDARQEFVLLSDVLGISSLVENINHKDTPDATDATVLGPFHMTVSPKRELGDSIDDLGKPNRVLVAGTVKTPDGVPIAGASVDVWQADENGFYDVQVPDVQPPGNGRGLFTSDDEGRFWFTTIIPSHYPIPTDGPVGVLLGATSRHPYRPAHIHFLVTAPGYAELTTHIFIEGSPYLDSDAVFAVKASLIRHFSPRDDAVTAAACSLSNPFDATTVDLDLQPEPHAS